MVSLLDTILMLHLKVPTTSHPVFRATLVLVKTSQHPVLPLRASAWLNSLPYKEVASSVQSRGNCPLSVLSPEQRPLCGIRKYWVRGTALVGKHVAG